MNPKNPLKPVALGLLGLLLAQPTLAALTVQPDTSILDDDLNVSWAPDGSLFATQLAANANLVTDILTLTPTVNDPLTGEPHTISADEFKADSNDSFNLGRMSWFAATAWVNWLNAMDSGAGYLGHTEWRLPKVLPRNGTAFNFSMDECPGTKDRSYNLAGLSSELSHLFYNELGGKALRSPKDARCLTNRAVFGLPDPVPLMQNLQTNAAYWTQTSVDVDDFNSEDVQKRIKGTFIFDFQFGFQTLAYALDPTDQTTPYLYALPVRGDGVAVGDYDITDKVCTGKIDRKGRTVRLVLSIANHGIKPIKRATVTVTPTQAEQTYAAKTKAFKFGPPGKIKKLAFTWKTKAAGDVTFTANLADLDDRDADAAQDTASCTLTAPAT